MHFIPQDGERRVLHFFVTEKSPVDDTWLYPFIQRIQEQLNAQAFAKLIDDLVDTLSEKHFADFQDLFITKLTTMNPTFFKEVYENSNKKLDQ